MFMESFTPEILSLLEPYDPAIVEVAAAVRGVVLSAAPAATELVYDAFNAVAMGYTFTGRPGDAFCHIAVYSRWVNLGFNHGVHLKDPDGLLNGKGSRVRHLRMASTSDVDLPHVGRFLVEAIGRARGVESADPSIPGVRSIVRAVYPTRRRPAGIQGSATQDEP